MAESTPYPIVDLRGMGGKEKEMMKLFPELTRVSRPLYDFEDASGMKIEVKRTQFKSLQSWIDPLKYLSLTDEERKIIFRFVYYDKATGKCLEVVDTTLGEVVDRFIPKELKEPAQQLLTLFPKRGKLQFKLDIKWR